MINERFFLLGRQYNRGTCIRESKIILHTTTLFIIAAFLFQILSCVSETPAATGTNTKTDTFSEARFIEQGNTYLNQPTEDNFFAYINLYGSASKNGTLMLIQSYIQKQKELINFYKEKKNYPRARFYYNNLEGVDQSVSPESKLLNRELIKYYTAKKQYALGKSLKIKEGLVSEEIDFHALSDVQDFRKLLAEIYVERTYKSEDGIVRKDDPPALGSGIVVGNSHVLTAFHVIEHVFFENTSSYSITVKVQGRTVANAKVISWDSLSDLAVIRLPESIDMPYSAHALFGNSATLEQGFEVFCFGSHEGYTATLTKGIVSAVSRKAPEMGTWLQIDAALAPGASGGMLIGKDNLIYGLLVAGILFEDINFVVPSNVILRVLDRLIAGETIRRPWLGFLLEETPDRSVSVVYKFPSSPLAGFNVKAGDTIATINGNQIDSIEAAQNILYDLETGNLVKLSIQDSGGALKEVYATLANRPDYALRNALRYNDRLSTYYPYFGFELDPKTMKNLTVTIAGKSMQIGFFTVVRIRKSSYLENMGVVRGDWIGLVSDYFRNDNRYLEIIHLPKSIQQEKIAEHLYDYIFDLKKEKYEGNIL